MHDASSEDRFRMEVESNSHETRQFFEDLDEGQLEKLRAIINVIINSDGMGGAYYQGLISMMLDKKYGLCLACGKKHDEELAQMIPEPREEAKAELPSFPIKGSYEYDNLMALYGMEQDDDGSDRVMCINCKTWYESLEDRTKRPVAGCSGCIQKEKWG